MTVRPLRRVFAVVNGGTPTSEPENWDGEVAWATPMDLGRLNGSRISETQRTLTTEGLRTGSSLVPAGSLIISTRAPIGYVAETAIPMAFNQGCRGLVPRTELDVRFFRYQLAVSAEQLQSRGQGSTFVELSTDGLASFPLAVPPLAEQRAIADYLGAETARIDDLTTKYLEVVDRLVDQRGAITVAGVSGNPLVGPRRATSLAWLTEVPVHWPDTRLTLLARLGSGHTPSREHPEWWIDCTIPWITTGEVWQIRDDRIEYLRETRENISQFGVANSSAELHPAGTVVLSRTASAGFSAIMAAPMATSQDYVTWTCGSRLRPRFLLLCLRAMRQDLLGRLAMGSTHQTIYVPDIQSIRIPLPPVEEQDLLVEWVWERLHPIDAAADAVRRQIELLAERRQALITAAVTGQLDIPGVAA